MTGILGKNNVRVNFKKADSRNKEFAFMKAHELNNIEKLIKVNCDFCNGTGYKISKASNDEFDDLCNELCPRCNGYGHYYTKNIWRTGKNTIRQLIVETDNPDKENLSLIVNHLNKLFGYKFNVIKTLHGYHIIGSKIYPEFINSTTHKKEASLEWLIANTIVLNNRLHYNSDYWLPQESYEYMQNILKLDEELREYQGCGNYKDLFTSSLKNSGLLNCVGDFDVLYTVLSLKYGKSTLRISKKEKDDKYEEVII